MRDTMHAPLWQRLLDGGPTWGSLEVSHSRYGTTRHRLVVFPPGISPDERRLLRVWRSFPVWGTITWLVLDLLLAPTIGPRQALAVSVGACLCACAVMMVKTNGTRTRVRTLSVVRMAGIEDDVAAQRYAVMYSLAAELLSADYALAEGALSSVDHEAVVWRVYERLAVATTT